MICIRIKVQVKNDHCSKFSSLSNWKTRSLKKKRASTGLEPVTSANIGASNPVEALNFFQASCSAMIILHLYLQPLFKYELFHVYFTVYLDPLKFLLIRRIRKI